MSKHHRDCTTLRHPSRAAAARPGTGLGGLGRPDSADWTRQTGLGRLDSADWTRQTGASLHTAGPNNPDRDIRLDLLGPAAVGSGSGRSKESDADQSGMDG